MAWNHWLVVFGLGSLLCAAPRPVVPNATVFARKVPRGAGSKMHSLCPIDAGRRHRDVVTLWSRIYRYGLWNIGLGLRVRVFGVRV